MSHEINLLGLAIIAQSQSYVHYIDIVDHPAKQCIHCDKEQYTCRWFDLVQSASIPRTSSKGIFNKQHRFIVSVSCVSSYPFGSSLACFRRLTRSLAQWWSNLGSCITYPKISQDGEEQGLSALKTPSISSVSVISSCCKCTVFTFEVADWLICMWCICHEIYVRPQFETSTREYSQMFHFQKKTNTRKNLVPMTLRLISSSFSSTFPSFASVSLQVSSKWVLALVRLFLLGACQHKVSHVNPAHKHAQTEQCWNTWDAWNQMAGANIKPACLRIQPRLQRQVLSSAWIWGTG